LLLFDGGPLIVHRSSPLCSVWFAEVVGGRAPEQDLASMPVRLVSDEVAYQGPVGGIYYGSWQPAATPPCDSCDSCSETRSDVGISSISFRARRRRPALAGPFQTLHAVYRKSCLRSSPKQLGARAD